jgi:hypothetical protein
MRIRYSNGNTAEAVLLARTNDSIRVEVQGGSDVVEFRQINGRWISEDCEPVEVEFAWMRPSQDPIVSIDDYICPPEVAERLIRMLFAGEITPETIEAAKPVGGISAPPVPQHPS